MSQIYKNGSGGGGPIPPQVPERFNTDVNSPSIPIANVENIFGGQTSFNNLLGIQTDGSSGSNTITIELTNRLFGGASTDDASTHPIITFALDTDAAVYTFDGFISAYNLTNTSGAGYFFSAAVRSTGAAAIDLGNEFTSVFQEPGMSAASVSITVSGNSVIFNVTGIAANNITWLAQATYSRTP